MNIIEKYDNKYIRSLIQLVPFGIGSGINTYLQEVITKFREERLKSFFDCLESGKIELTEDLIESENFLHNYFSTVRIVLNTRRREKIRMIGNLFNSCVRKNIVNSQDTYEHYLKILDELTYTEIKTLQILYKYESETQNKEPHLISKLNAIERF